MKYLVKDAIQGTLLRIEDTMEGAILEKDKWQAICSDHKAVIETVENLDTHDKLNSERSDTHMTKLDAIKTLTDNGIFDLAQEIIFIIKSDDADNHAAANKNILNLIDSINQMQNWTLFGWQKMIDLTDQAYGFTKYAAYSKLDVCADVYDQIDELHTILWNNFSSMKIWND